ncbi:DNA-binding response regulator [Paenibacillus sp. 598K]|uniref:response regulator n=1 Tax=Paenibacillus sp. 598K TaxID=1117987 RepID=UPI000FFAE813|nr:response regulator [Paenibacillus sp. 598K]GBF76814.1 DNA-binding response regulator [Paenibacillus sp. 598K]
MHKLLIVDDEALVCEAIREQMDWEKMGFVCIGACEDGVEALAFIEREQPDVVLTDIGMPFMDGIELTHELSMRYPDVKVVILTGYDDFEYARQAVQMKVTDYILKPVTAAEMETIMRRLGGQLDQEHTQKRDYERLKRRLHESMPLLKERYLERMVASSMTAQQMREGCTYYGLRWSGPWFIELAIDVDEWAVHEPLSSSDDALFRFAIYNITQEVLKPYAGVETYRDRENRILVIMTSPEQEELRERAGRAAEEIHRALADYLPLKCSIGIGHVYREEDNLGLIHRTALSALDYRFAAGSGSIIRITDMEQDARPQLLSVVRWENELITRLKTGAPQEMAEWVDRLIAAFREQRFPIDVCTLYLQRFTLSLMHTLYEMGSDIDRTFGDAAAPLEEIKRLATLADMERWVRSLCEQAMTLIRNTREAHSMQQVAKAMAYVQTHYMDPELSLKIVCRHVAISTSYFSTMFKSVTGKTFVEYVIEERMEKAKELLKLTQMRSYEIAYAVGYKDPQYFSSAFKKAVGCTPKEYRGKMAARQ